MEVIGNRNNKQVKGIEHVSEQHSNNSLALRQPENITASLIFVTYVASYDKINKETFEEVSIEDENREWHKAGIELKSRLEELRNSAEGYGYNFSDCQVSLAEYAEPELDEKNIISIKSLVLRIFHSEKFYCSTLEEAREALLEYCRTNRIPSPNEIICVVNGYYIKWNFVNGFKGNEIKLWKFLQKKLHESFAKINPDASECLNATAMIPVPGFINSNYVTPFDLCDRTTLVYSDDENYLSPSEFASKLSLSASEITEYRKINGEHRNSHRSRKKANKQPVELSVEPDVMESTKTCAEAITASLRDENCTGEEYRYYQYRTTETKKKTYKWLAINGVETLPRFDRESDSWISAATYYSRFRRKGNIASINCNFLIINWKKSVLEYMPTPEQGKELVLSRCRELGLPEPEIVSTPDGLEVKWYWNDKMTKILYEHDPYHARFNNDWEAIQKKLYEKFWYLGADPKKLCVTVMFRVPGSKDTRKTLKKSADRIIRKIHQGEIAESYRTIQRALGIKETYSDEQPEVFDEVAKQKWERFSVDNPELAKDWEADVLRIHPSSQNWVCFGFIGENKKWNNRWTQACELRKYLLKLIYRPEFSTCDFYVSQGEFFSRNDRTVKNLASINANFVDLDYKILVGYRPEITENPSPKEWETLIKAHCEKFGIPLPNDVVFTGGGVHLKWIYDEPISRSELELWQYAQSLLLSQFKTLGADPASSDAARVLRLVGSENHKDSPIIHERIVHVIDREFFSAIKITLSGLVEGLEKSQPENPEEFNAIKTERQSILAQLSAKEENILRPEAEVINVNRDSEEYKIADNYYWLESTLRHHKLHATYLEVEVSGAKKWVETYHLHNALRMLFGTPDVKLSLSELKGQERVEQREAIEWIPCNYVMLSRCPGVTFEEQKRNIFNRCHEYRDVGFPEPNQIIRIGGKLLVEWTYQSVLTGLALSRWQDTQEFICRHFEDWGAMDDREYLKATALLPVPGFEYDGEMARLEYSELTKRYTFNRLAKAVLHFSQKEVEEYRKRKAEEKAKREQARCKPTGKIALSEEVSARILNAPNDNYSGSNSGYSSVSEAKASKYKNMNFQMMAGMRYTDIVRWLDLQRGYDGEIPQNVRELCVFWALVFAKQAGLIKTWAEFEAKAQELIDFCGYEFSKECTVKTVKSAYTKEYHATTNYLIRILQITPEAQKQMKVLCVGVRATAQKRQPREEWLAEHSQEREKPWEALGVSRATYFNWKKAGTLPSQFEEQALEESQKQLDWCVYIMSAKILSFVISRYVSLIRCYWWLYRYCAFLSVWFLFLGSTSIFTDCLLRLILRLYSSRYSGHLKFLKRRRGKRKKRRKKCI